MSMVMKRATHSSMRILVLTGAGIALAAWVAAEAASAGASAQGNGPKVQFVTPAYRIHYMAGGIRPQVQAELAQLPPRFAGPVGVNYQWYFPTRMGPANFNIGLWENWDEFSKQGILTFARPKDFDALLAHTWADAERREQAMAKGTCLASVGIGQSLVSG